MMRSRTRLRNKSRAQTTLEYFMMLAVFVIPAALAINSLLEDSKPNEKDNIMRNIVTDAMGDGDKFGVIGAPYP